MTHETFFKRFQRGRIVWVYNYGSGTPWLKGVVSATEGGDTVVVLLDSGLKVHIHISRSSDLRVTAP